MAGDPINTATGNAYRQDDDYVGSPWLTLRRFYNSALFATAGGMGSQWRHSFDRTLTLTGSPTIAITLNRPDGKGEQFSKTNGVWTTSLDITDTLSEIDNGQGAATGYTVFIAGSRQTETYDATGRLQTVTDDSGQGISLTYSISATPPTLAPTAGLLLSVSDPEGREINFSYNSNGLVNQITLPDGGLLTYSYDANENLISVQYPDGKMRQYVYNESSLTGGANLPSSLTGVVDETGTRYESTTYNSDGLATSSSFAGNVGTTTITYNSNYTSTVQYPLGATTTMQYVSTASGLFQQYYLNAPCGKQCNQPWRVMYYDSNGFPSSYYDFDNNITATTYSHGLLTQQIDADSQSTQRTTNISWNIALRLPLSRTVSNAKGTVVSNTQWVYNATGQTLARCDIDPTNSAASGYSCSNTGTVPSGVRRWTYTYCTAVGSGCPLVGLMLSAIGPRTDLTQTTTYTYYTASSALNCGTPGAACYQAGDLYQVTDALGHVTTIAAYDADGRITRITDSNGINTDTTYTPRGWLATRTVNGVTTTFTYTPYGAVASVADADGVTTSYTYDAAHRLTKVTDELGNYIQYTLDAAGDVTQQQTFDPSGTLHTALSRTFNTLGQLTSVVDGLNNTVFNAGSSGSYDANGNLIQSSDALGIQRKLGYDALNRLVTTINDYAGTDSLTPNTTTSYTFDSLDRVTQITDPSNLSTTYSFDGLSDATGQVSPDTGTTSRTFDAAGNVLTSTDAKGITATNMYDALNRLTSSSYADTTQNVTYTYDEANSVTGCSTSYPKGRLTRIIENSVTTVFCYDAWGRVIQKQKITAAATDTAGYTYTAAGRLSGVVYSDGTIISYTRDGDGRIQSVSVAPPGGSASTVVSNATYQPFGPVSGYTLGNGQTITRVVDQNYRLTDLTSPAFTLHVARDAMGDITAIGNASGANPATETYTYDPLHRLTAITEANGSVLESVTYNLTGDRLSKTGAGLATGAYSYNPNTHQLIATGTAARSVDADGNTTAITEAGSTYGFGYSDRNRMTVAQLAGNTIANYTYDALGQRIQKAANGQTERYLYNEAGQMLAEYGATNRDYIWLDGIPVANVDTSNGVSTITYVTADQLGRPRVIADVNGNTLWQLPYQGNPFEELQPVSNGYTYNLRSAGEYYDTETGLNDNVQRPRDTSVWRFLQSDISGFAGGISTYAAVENNPRLGVDPLGLRDVIIAVWQSQGTSVGHVFAGEMDGTTILSQFPHDVGGTPWITGPNTQLTWQQTMTEEGRDPTAVYMVNLPDDFGFDWEAGRNRNLPKWQALPHEYSGNGTNCTVSTQEALEDGGIPVPRPSDGILTPDAFLKGMNSLIQAGNPNIRRISNVPWQ